ncbi:MAG TPA: hypothetical protein VGU26_08565 [Gaiellaceae bacterium]|jgi:hypothetical protein|nr:hypothetical protein [Gaiellaceae bacterium]
MSGRALLAAATAAAVLLAAGYAALGGGRYTPPRTAAPCDQRPSPPASGIEALVSQLALVALDGAACALDVSREELTLAFFSDAESNRLAANNDLAPTDVERAVRAGLMRAVEDARRRGAIDAATARLVAAVVALAPLKSVVENLPIVKERSP